MAKHVQLTIPESCHENWDAMSPVQKGRFCNACQKQVVDFTRMSDAQVAAFFKKPATGSVCGRFMEDQLDRDIEIPRKRIPWIKYFFQFALPAFLASSKGYTQGVIIRKEKLAICAPDKLTDSIVFPEREKLIIPDSVQQKHFIGGARRETKFLIEGKVTDEMDNPVPYASVMFKGTKIGTQTDSAGNFRLRSEGDKAALVASCIGYGTMEMTIDPKKMRNPVTLRLPDAEVMGLIFIKPKNQMPPPSLIKTISDTLFKKFKLFPNPVEAGADLNIQCEKMEEGYYSLQLLTLSGGIVFRKEVWIDDKARLMNIPVPAVAAGTYLFRVTNKASGRSSTQKIVIQ